MMQPTDHRNGNNAAALSNPVGGTRLWSAAQVLGGALEIIGGSLLLPTVAGAAPGVILVGHGLDTFLAGAQGLISGEYQHTLTYEFVKDQTGSSTAALIVDMGIPLVAGFGGSVASARALASSPAARLDKFVAAYKASQSLSEAAGPLLQPLSRLGLAANSGVQARHKFSEWLSRGEGGTTEFSDLLAGERTWRQWYRGKINNFEEPGTWNWLETQAHESVHNWVGEQLSPITFLGDYTLFSHVKYVEELVAWTVGHLRVGRLHMLPLVPLEAAGSMPFRQAALVVPTATVPIYFASVVGLYEMFVAPHVRVPQKK